MHSYVQLEVNQYRKFGFTYSHLASLQDVYFYTTLVFTQPASSCNMSTHNVYIRIHMSQLLCNTSLMN